MRHLTSYLTIPSHSSLSLVPFLNISWEKGRKSNCHPVMGGQLNLPEDVRPRPRVRVRPCSGEEMDLCT